MKATRLVAQVEYVECPSCGERVEGFLNDPRGAGEVDDEGGIECEKCHVVFSIPSGIEVILN